MNQLSADLIKLPFLDSKNYYELESFARLVKIDLFMPGDILLKEGDIASNFFFIMSGEMRVISQF